MQKYECPEAGSCLLDMVLVAGGRPTMLFVLATRPHSMWAAGGDAAREAYAWVVGRAAVGLVARDELQHARRRRREHVQVIAPVLALDEGALGDCAWFCLSVHGSYKSTPSVIRT